MVIVPKIKYNQECERKTDGFFQRFEASISNFYLEQSAIRVYNDSIGILQPFYTYNSYGECYPEKIENNLLIVYNFKENKTKVYDNILIPDSINSYQELISNKTSFIIHSEQGHSYTFFTNIFVTQTKIDSIQLESTGWNQYTKTYRFRNLYLGNFKLNIIDSLRGINDVNSP